jgi:hypothetical protein
VSAESNKESNLQTHSSVMARVYTELTLQPVKEANFTAKDTKLDNGGTTLRPAYLEAGDPDPNYIVEFTSVYGTHDIMRYACNNPSLHSPQSSASISLTWL